MATRANIAIVLKPEDQNVPLNFMSDRFKDVRPLVGMVDIGKESEIEFTDVIANKPVLQIYNHNELLAYANQVKKFLCRQVSLS